MTALRPWVLTLAWSLLLGGEVKAAPKITRLALLDLPVRVSQAAGEHAGHGELMAREIARICERRCEVFPIAISQTGTDLGPRAYSSGVEQALRAHVSVIVIPSGARAGRDPKGEAALARVLEKAAGRGVPVFAAAGTGLTNPYRPDPLQTLIPQRFPSVWVVAAASAKPLEDETLLSSQNSGPELRFRVIAPSSSVAAVRLAAWVSRGEVRRGSMTMLERSLRARFGAGRPITTKSSVSDSR